MATPSTIPAIYAIINRENGKMYIGSSLNYPARWRAHRNLLKRGAHHSKHLQHAYMRHGVDIFDYSIIEYIDNPIDLLKREQTWINFFKPIYNIAKVAGRPRLGLKASPETRAKMSASLKGRKRQPFSDEWRKNISKSKKGIKHTPESCAKMSLQRIGNKSHTGRTFTEEHRKNLSLARVGNSNASGFKYHPSVYDSRRGERKKKA